jgi:hypothetical protein
MKRGKIRKGMFLMLRPRTKGSAHHFLSYFIGEAIVTWAHFKQKRLGNAIIWVVMCPVELYFCRKRG